MKHHVDEKGIIYLEQPRVPAISLVISLFSLLLISLGAFSILALQQPLNQTQNTISKASVQNGPVVLGTQQSPAQFLTKQNNSVIITANTKGYQTQGVVAIFNVITSTTDSLNVQVISNSNLKATTQEIQKTTNGFLVKVVAEPAGSAPFATTTAVPFLNITFDPTNSGAFNLAFDQVYSHVYLANSRQEVLGVVPLMNFNVADSGTTANNSCNKSCSTNRDCPANLFCYSNGQCRSATDPTSSTCPITTVTADRVCNQDCSNSAQCQNGLSCFNNRCRVPGNPDSTVCSTVTQVVYTNIVKACNQSCNANKDCAVNLRCYSGVCRLATNTSSLSCTPSNVPIITSAYPANANLLVGTKGEEIVLPSASPSATALTKPATTSATVKSVPFVWPSPVPVVIVSPAPKVTPQPVATSDSTNPLANFLAKLRASSNSGISFPLIAVVAGVVLLIIALMFLLKKKPTALKPPATTQTNGMPQQPKPAAPAVQTLEERIAQLKAAQPSPTASLAPAAPTPAVAAPVAPVVTKPEPTAPVTAPASDEITVPPSALSLQAAPVPANPISSVSSSTMMQRLKDKGLMSNTPAAPTTPASADQKPS